MNTKRKYHPWNAKAQTWDYIENRYTEDWNGKQERLLELVRHIKNSNFKDRLFGSTSMDKLVVSIYDPIDYRKEALHITFDLWSRKWRFEYIAMPFQEPEFIRTYDEEKGIEKFDNFIKMIKW
ncbi:MAG: hypothetical protein NWP87_07875 [Winogradskyella sp.]|nr:hypothetical protein [Winogradskyella sp.]